MTTTPELAAAAEKLRRLAGQADDGPWETTWRGQEYHLDGYRDGELHSISEWTYAIATWEPKVHAERADCDTANPDYIAAMHPSVGKALADWLGCLSVLDPSERGGDKCGWCGGNHALAVARALTTA